MAASDPPPRKLGKLDDPHYRSLLCFLAGLPLTLVVIWLADPLLEPVRQSKPLRLVVFPAFMGWIMLASGYGMWVALGRQAKEVQSSPSATGGVGSGCMMALNGMILLLAAIMLAVFFATE